MHTGLPAWRIGHRLGFSDPANFGKFFHARTATTPADFRATHCVTGPLRGHSRTCPRRVPVWGSATLGVFPSPTSATHRAHQRAD